MSTSPRADTLLSMESSSERPRLSSKRPSVPRTLALAAASIAVVAGLMVASPSPLQLIGLAAAFILGSAVERYRQGRVPAPPTLARTPAAWWSTLTGRIDPTYGAGAILLIAAAAAILTLASGAEGPSSTTTGAQPTPPQAGPHPTVRVRNEAAQEPFTVAGATFRVIPAPGAPWAQAIEAQDPGAGQRWITVSIEITNLHRSRFNPALLSYRLRGTGALYSPERGGIVGPGALGTRQGLPRGASAEERLAFGVPAGAARLALTFEPKPNGPLQLRVPLPPP